uniref:autotransporter outer membrane beta-barrel domain-containing protein n=1 Tax=Escherichia coli TaxID=562 RepID=UPI001FF3E0A3
EKRVFLVILFTSFSGSLVSRIPGAVHYESLLGRASMILGYDITAGNSQLNIYVKTGAIREFSGDTEYQLNNSREKYSFKGNGWNNGVGVSAQYNKQHTFYLEADYTQGNLFDQKQVNGGYRFSF